MLPAGSLHLPPLEETYGEGFLEGPYDYQSHFENGEMKDLPQQQHSHQQEHKFDPDSLEFSPRGKDNNNQTGKEIGEKTFPMQGGFQSFNFNSGNGNPQNFSEPGIFSTGDNSFKPSPQPSESPDGNANLVRAELEIQLFHKPRGLKGMWQKIEPEDSIRVTKDKGKHIKVQISAPPQIQEIDINGNRFDVFLVHSETNTETREGFWIEPCKSKICQNRVELEVKLLKIAKNIQYGVRIECGNLFLTGRSVRFSTHDNGKQRSSRSPNRSPNRSPIRSPNRSPRGANHVPPRSRAASSPYPLAPPYTKFEKLDPATFDHNSRHGSTESINLPNGFPLFTQLQIPNPAQSTSPSATSRVRPAGLDIHFRTSIEELNDAIDYIHKSDHPFFEWDGRSAQQFTGGRRVISLLGYELFRSTQGIVFRDEETDSYSVALQHIVPLLVDCFKQFLYSHPNVSPSTSHHPNSGIRLPSGSPSLSPSVSPSPSFSDDLNQLRTKIDGLHFPSSPNASNVRANNLSQSAGTNRIKLEDDRLSRSGGGRNSDDFQEIRNTDYLNQQNSNNLNFTSAGGNNTLGGHLKIIYQQACERSAKIVITIDWLKSVLSDVSFMLVCREHITTSQTCVELSTRRSKILFLSSSNEDFLGSYQLGVNLKGASLEQLQRSDPNIRVYDFRQGLTTHSELVRSYDVKGEGDKWLVGSLVVSPSTVEFRSIYCLLVDTIPREFLGDQSRVDQRRFANIQPSQTFPSTRPTHPTSFSSPAQLSLGSPYPQNQAQVQVQPQHTLPSHFSQPFAPQFKNTPAPSQLSFPQSLQHPSLSQHQYHPQFSGSGGGSLSQESTNFQSQTSLPGPPRSFYPFSVPNFFPNPDSNQNFHFTDHTSPSSSS